MILLTVCWIYMFDNDGSLSLVTDYREVKIIIHNNK